MTPTESWHADIELLAAYVSGRVDRASAASVETHLVACTSCRSTIAPLVEPQRLERNLGVIVDRITQPRRHPFERLVERLGVPSHLARALAVSPSELAPWLAGIVSAVLVAAGADVISTTGRSMFVLLVVAPLLPLAGVTAGASLGSDPLAELVAATPTTRLRLLLLRSVVVLVPALVLSATASVVAPSRGWEPVLWLLPALALSATALAAGTWISIRPAAWALGGLWVAGAVVAARGAPSAEMVGDFVAFRPIGQVALLAVSLACTGVAFARRHQLDFVDLRSAA